MSITPAVKSEPEKAATWTKKKKGAKKGKAGNKEQKTEQSNPGNSIGIVTDKNGGRRISGIGRDDYIALAREALNNALNDGIKDERILFRYSQVTEDDGDCTFAGATDRILCGSSLLILGPKQQLFAAGDAEVYGHSFMGLNGAYRISKSWSLSKAVERMASISRYEKFAKEVNRYAESLESQGKNLEAAQVRSLAVEDMKSGKTGVSLDSILPGIHSQ